MDETDPSPVVKDDEAENIGVSTVDESTGDVQTEEQVTSEIQQHSAQKDQDDSTKEDTAEEEVVEVSVDPAVIDKLTTGLLGMFLPNLQKAKGSLNELLHNQEVLIETVQQENSKFTESVAMEQLKETMQQAKVYHSKLLHLKREMGVLTERSTKLKRRAVKLQQQKQKEQLTRAAQHERELERERMLTAKVAKPVPQDNETKQQ